LGVPLFSGFPPVYLARMAETDPETRYTMGDHGYIAHQVFGSGRLPVLLVTNWLQNLDVMWDEPTLAHYLNRLGSFSRVLCFDKRGTGVSDPVPLNSLPTLERWIDDARVAMDATGTERAALIGDTEGGPMAIMFAATFPHRVSALVLVNSFARWRRADDYPIGMPDATAQKLVDRYEQNWGVTAEILGLTAPSMADDARFRRWYTRYQRLAMPRGAAATQYNWVTHLDVRSVLPTIRVPTLVLCRSGARHHRPEFSHYLAEHITGAKLVTIPGSDSYPLNAGDVDPLLDEIEQFLTGSRAEPARDRMLATILFTDIVDSTRLAAEHGDAAWTELLRRHDEIVREHLTRYRGREINYTGDGFLAIFDGPARAITCAARMKDELAALGVEVRAGLHAGEVEMAGSQVSGLAVHIAARVLAVGGPGAIMVSGTVKDLVVGSGIEFAERGVHELKGVPGTWSLHQAIVVP
jgi:class 3 adenylate cyclase